MRLKILWSGSGNPYWPVFPHRNSTSIAIISRCATPETTASSSRPRNPKKRLRQKPVASAHAQARGLPHSRCLRAISHASFPADHQHPFPRQTAPDSGSLSNESTGLRIFPDSSENACPNDARCKRSVLCRCASRPSPVPAPTFPPPAAAPITTLVFNWMCFRQTEFLRIVAQILQHLLPAGKSG